jgi:hypothetical protein
MLDSDSMNPDPQHCWDPQNRHFSLKLLALLAPEERHVGEEWRGAAQGEDAGYEGVLPVLLPHRHLPDFRQQKHPETEKRYKGSFPNVPGSIRDIIIRKNTTVYSSVLVRIRNPVLFRPLDPDPGSRLPTRTTENLGNIFVEMYVRIWIYKPGSGSVQTIRVRSYGGKVMYCT